MYTISFNIGYESESSGILNRYPMVYQLDSVSKFCDFIRKNCIHFADWAKQNHVPKSSIVLYTTFYRAYTEDGEEWVWSNEFSIKLKNVRDYKPLIGLSDQEIEALLREDKIDNILNG